MPGGIDDNGFRRPCDDEVSVANPGHRGSLPQPPEVDPADVAAADDPDRFFGERPDRRVGERERAVAEWLRGRGYRVRSVYERPGKVCPDAVFENGAGFVSVDFKHTRAGTLNSFQDALRDAKRQSSRVIIDARDTELTQAELRERLGAAIQRVGRPFELIVVIVPGGNAVLWSR